MVVTLAVSDVLRVVCVGTDVNCLVNIGFERDSLLVFTFDLKESKVSHVLILNVGVACCLRHTLMIRLCINPPLTIVGFDILETWVVFPFGTTIAEWTKVLFAAPRIPDAQQLCSIF